MDQQSNILHQHEHHTGHCRELLGNLSEFIDGNLEQQLCSEIERHLHDCENCRVVVDSLRKTVSLYQATAASPVVPQGVRERLYKCLNMEEYLLDQPG